MKHLIILGARGWGREVYAGAKETQAYRDGEFDIKGFLDSKADALNGNYPPIICAPEDYEIQPDDVFFVAMGEPQWRKHYAELMEQKGAEFMTIIVDGSSVNNTSTIGPGSYISKWTKVSDNAVLGKHVMVHSFSSIGHDVNVGDYASIESQCFLGGYAKVGDESILHVRTHIAPHKSIGNRVIVGGSSVVIRNFGDDVHLFGNPAKKMEF